MHRITSTILAMTLAGCGKDAPLTQPPLRASVAADRASVNASTAYSLSILPTLGGTSRGNAIDEQGTAGGYSNVSASIRHAVLWQNRALVDLGTLGGPSSNIAWPGFNARGMVVGISHTSMIDDLAEDWSCSAFLLANPAHNACRGFVWEAGRMRELPTFGGANGFAAGINSRGDVVGWAENRVLDPTCVAPQQRQFRAALWDAKTSMPTELPPLASDVTSAATAINARGQVVGISGECGTAIGGLSARHAVLWDHGTVTDLGSFGGSAWNTPMAINDAGDIVGFSDRPGDSKETSNEHAFLWTRKDGMIDLGTLPGDVTSQASGINARRQIVGTSCDLKGCRAFLWQNGVMTNLSTFIPSLAATDTLTTAQDINASGQITGRIVDRDPTRRLLAFQATPAEFTIHP